MKNLFELIPHHIYIIVFATLIGSLSGEILRETYNGKKCVIIEFIVTFFSSWVISISVALIVQGSAHLAYDTLIGVSTILGFLGHKTALKVVPYFSKLIEQDNKGDDKK